MHWADILTNVILQYMHVGHNIKCVILQVGGIYSVIRQLKYILIIIYDGAPA